SKLAREQGAVVILNGDGSDEILCGYTKYLKYLRVHRYWNAMRSMPSPILRAANRMGERFGVNGVPGEILSRAANGDELYIGGTSALKSLPGFRDVVDGGTRGAYASVRMARTRFDAMRSSDDYAEWLSYWGMRSEVEPVFLYRADRMGMANSVEIRVPFLDHKLVEFAMQMPQELKYRNATAKYILKKSLEPVVPHEFLYRRKMGFCVPVREWAGAMMHDEIRSMLPAIADHLGESGRRLLSGVDAMIEAEGDTSDGGVTWELYTLATWYRRWFGENAE
ncbi:MAG: asparagine synthase, partial [bacterium]|nr:asparagine synthase [Candidatus Kapabacteria bacterium]